MAPYDLAVIGSGPGGYVAAIRAAQWKLKTIVIEKDPYLGGTCLHVGCIPTKVLLHHAELYEQIQRAAEFGLTVSGCQIDWPAMLERKNRIVSKHARGIEYLFRKNQVERIQGRGRLAGPGRVAVEHNGQTTLIEARYVLLATGSEARALPGVTFDGERILSNREILSLPQIPRSLIVVGGGAVGVEFASIYRSFGTEVTLLEALPRLVPLEDEEISAELERAFRRRGIRVLTQATVESVTRSDTGVHVDYRDRQGNRQNLAAECVLVAIGRKPNTEELGLEHTRVRLERGFVHTNAYLQTDEPNLYAIGDIVAGLPQLAHAASMEGIIAVGHMAGRPVPAFDRRRVPNATYCEPQVASIGLTEAQARAAGYQVRIGKFPFTANSKASILGQHEGFIKVVAEQRYGEVLGVHIIGPLATEIIAEAAAAIGLEATVDDMMFTIHAHPTLWEAMGDAFNATQELAIHI